MLYVGAGMPDDPLGVARARISRRPEAFAKFRRARRRWRILRSCMSSGCRLGSRAALRRSRRRTVLSWQRRRGGRNRAHSSGQQHPHHPRAVDRLHPAGAQVARNPRDQVQQGRRRAHLLRALGHAEGVRLGDLRGLPRPAVGGAVGRRRGAALRRWQQIAVRGEDVRVGVHRRAALLRARVVPAQARVRDLGHDARRGRCRRHSCCAARAARTARAAAATWCAYPIGRGFAAAFAAARAHIGAFAAVRACCTFAAAAHV